MAKCENCYHNEMCQAMEDCSGLTRIPADFCDYYKDKSLIVELPCRVGDTVYYINKRFHIALHTNSIYEATVVRIVITDKFTSAVIQIHNENGCTEIPDIKDFGKTVFLSREEAENALKEREKNA